MPLAIFHVEHLVACIVGLATGRLLVIAGFLKYDHLKTYSDRTSQWNWQRAQSLIAWERTVFFD
jgi:hypothetical protein